MLRQKTIRLFLLIAGHLSLAVGFVGIFLPLLPTVPFLLLAAFCYERGSPKIHRWLLENTYLGPPLSRWKETHSIPVRAKCVAVCLIALGIGMSIYRVQNIWLDAMLLVVGAGAALFIVTRPSR